ncbi:hypothetical protein [Spiroplasma endosymbiont of Tipula paludosa]|uniref:hypothetical protein n=1 Tax=Spiroplasma endosymbiont of Tipula paludosa TaxID=3066295 RepID=UPI0035C8908E
MFMKIFTVLIISFNNIFTIPQNINNDKITTQSLIRNKRQSNETYEFTLSKARINWMWDGFRQNFSIALSEFDKNESGLNKLPIDFKNTLAMKNSYIYLDEEGISTLKTDNLGRNGNLKVTNIKGKIIKTQNFYNWLEFNFQHKKTTDIELPTTTTNFDGNHKYSDVIDNLDYLMVHRGDFDKFNYSYLYWTPVFNFINSLEKGYYKEFTIKNHGFKNESYFYHKTSSSEDEINKNVLKIKAFNKTLIAGNNYLQLLHGESEIWKYNTVNANDYYLIKYLFGTLNYLDVRFSFLRYDPDLKNDIYLYFKNNIPSINNSDYKNVFDEIYEILGNFFASLFYATFDMDEKTHTEIGFKGVDNYKKDHFIQIGFFYRSLITFYPKKYLINVTGNSELLLRSYFFTFDKKTYQGNYNAINNNNSIYQIDFNVLKSYDNKLITLPADGNANSINYLNTDIDIRYGINIFTLTFPLFLS